MKKIKTINLLLLAIAMIFSTNMANAEDWTISDATTLNDFIINSATGDTGNVTLNFNLDENWTSPTIEKNITIQGENGVQKTISGSKLYKGFEFGSDANVTIQNLILREMKTNTDGAALRYGLEGTLTITNSEFNENEGVNGWGGAVYFSSNNGIGTITNSKFKNNLATEKYGRGGAIYNNKGTINIIDSEFEGNKSEDMGGAIYNNDTGTINITRSRFIANEVTDYYTWGGAIYNDGRINITSSIFQNNKTLKANSNGGAIFNNDDGITNIINSEFKNNEAKSDGGAIYNRGTIDISSGGTFNSNSANGGGAIYNESGTVTISGSNEFNSNSASGGGGAIYNKSGTVTISGTTFDSNEAYSGGAIYNTSGTSGTNGTVNIYSGSTFNSNSATYGGAIYNTSGTSGTNGTVNIYSGSTFNSNSATYGGAIYNTSGTNGTVNIYSGSTFNSNSADLGGAIYNNTKGTITISGTTFDSNKANYSNTSKGGAIYSNDGTVNIYSGTTFDSNEAKSQGGAIYNNSGTVTISDTTFDSNKTTKYSGGAIYNGSGKVTITGGTFSNNEAKSGGGAISSNSGTITLNSTNTFTGNKANGTPNDISNNGTLNINSGTTTMDGGITGSGKTYIKGGTLALKGNAITSTTATTPFSNTLYLNGGTLSIADGNINTFYMNNVELTANSNLALDADLKNETIDQISIKTPSFTSDKYITISNINLLSDAKKETVKMSIFADEATKDIKDSIKCDLKGIYYSPIYGYNAKYDGEENIVFTRISNSYNPAVKSAAVGAQVGAYLTQLQNYNEAFANMDSTMLMTFEQRMAMKYANKYASLNPEEKFSFSPNQIPEQSKGLWVNPYTSFERVNLNNGPKVDAITYGTLFGGDSGLIELKHGWDMVLGAYVGYNGSSMHYDNVTVVNNGGTLGFNSVFYKGNFFTGLTANVGASGAESSTPYGNDAFAMLSTGIASKTGYNWELFNSKLIIQPSFLISYTFVNTFDYTNCQGVSISSDPLHAIQLAPGVKLIGNLPHGWQPYIGVQMIWNLMDKSKCYANDVALPEISTDPYVQYGIGVQKRWGERCTGYGQAMVRNGGRNGVALSAGFRWALGKDSKTSSAKSNKTSELIKNRKSNVSLSLR